MIKLALIGFSITHSLSPRIHSIAMEHLNIEGTYELIDLNTNEENDLSIHLEQKPSNEETQIADILVLEAIKRPKRTSSTHNDKQFLYSGKLHYFFNLIKPYLSQDYWGFNITSPLKEYIPLAIKHIKNEHASLNHIASNTLFRSNGLWTCVNTDIYGAQRTIQQLQISENDTICILGGGGTAKTLLYSLVRSNKYQRIYVCLRDETQLSPFIQIIPVLITIPIYFCSRAPRDLVLNTYKNFARIFTFPWKKRVEVAQQSSVIINTTTLGLHGESPLPLDEDYPSVRAYFDILYYPYETALLKKFKNDGKMVLNGIDWFIEQANESFHYWTGKHFNKTIIKKFSKEYAQLANRR
ncbi:MAG: hypothetical protein N2450_07585 [bacterium]|nr:hypothetical protein [bacterium]